MCSKEAGIINSLVGTSTISSKIKYILYVLIGWCTIYRTSELAAEVTSSLSGWIKGQFWARYPPISDPNPVRLENEGCVVIFLAHPFYLFKIMKSLGYILINQDIKYLGA